MKIDLKMVINRLKLAHTHTNLIAAPFIDFNWNEQLCTAHTAYIRQHSDLEFTLIDSLIKLKFSFLLFLPFLIEMLRKTYFPKVKEKKKYQNNNSG